VRPFDVAFAVVLFLGTIVGLRNKRLAIRVDGALVGLSLLLGMAVASLSWTTDVPRTSTEIIQVVEWIGLYVVLTMLVKDYRGLCWLLSTLFAVIVLTESMRYSIVGMEWLRFGVQRVRPWSVMVGFALVILLGDALAETGHETRGLLMRHKTIRYMIAGVLSFAMAISLDRKVWVGLPVAALSMFVISPASISRKLKRLVPVLGVLLLGIIVVALSSAPAWEYVKVQYSTLSPLLGGGASAARIGPRLAASQSAIEFIKLKPLTGSGMGVLDPLYRTLFLSRGVSRNVIEPHNMILDYGVFLGSGGVLIVMLLISIPIHRLIQLRRQSRRSGTFIILIGLTAYVIIILLTNSGGLERDGLLIWLLALTRKEPML